MSRSSILAAATFVTLVAMSGTPSANKNFMPDWTFTGSSLAETAQLGDAKWTAQNGEVTGSPSSADGGILLFKNPLQDVQVAASFRCAAGCQAGLMLRVEQTSRGLQGSALCRNLRHAWGVRRHARSAGTHQDEGSARARERNLSIPGRHSNCWRPWRATSSRTRRQCSRWCTWRSWTRRTRSPGRTRRRRTSGRAQRKSACGLTVPRGRITASRPAKRNTVESLLNANILLYMAQRTALKAAWPADVSTMPRRGTAVSACMSAAPLR